MVDELASMGIELMITFWPFQSLESQHWQEYADNGYLATNLTGGVISFDGSDQYLVDQINPVRMATTARLPAMSAAQVGQYMPGVMLLCAGRPERDVLELVRGLRPAGREGRVDGCVLQA